MPSLDLLRCFWQKVGPVILDGIYPRVCRHCDKLLPTDRPRTGIQAWLCKSCETELTEIAPPYCRVCGEPYDGAMTGAFRCWNCEGRRIAFDFAVSAFKAEGPLREMIHAFKYSRDLSLRAALVDLLRPALLDPRLASEDLTQWLMVPVPLHPLRQMWRGFNQSWELCTLLSQQTGIPAAQILRRRTRTRAQARLSQKARRANLRGAFALRAAFPWQRGTGLKGRRILLVDDVLTTGATAHECAKILKRHAGVEKVVVITAARG